MNEIKLDTRELDRIANSLDIKSEDVIRLIAFEIEAYAKRRAPRDTGALINSIYTVTRTWNGFKRAVRAVRRRNKKVVVDQLPAPGRKAMAVVGAGVEYAEYVEFGTRKMAAHPFLTPAVEAVIKRLNSGKMFEKLVK